MKKQMSQMQMREAADGSRLNWFKNLKGGAQNAT